jgi:AAA domain
MNEESRPARRLPDNDTALDPNGRCGQPEPAKDVVASKGVAPWHLGFAPLSYALANAPDEPLWTWEGYLAPGALTLIAGRPKVGKSTLAFALLKQTVTGEPFLGLATCASGVLLLSEEREGTLAEKARRWNLNGRVHLLMRHQAHGHPWPQVVDEAVAYCREHDLGVLVVDTFDKWSGLRGDAENNAGSVLEVLEPLQRAAAAGLAVLVVAHQRKSLGDFGEAVRGSNALTGTVDVVAELERPRSDVLAGEGVRVLNAVSRYSSTPEELVIALTDYGYEARGDTLEAQADAEREQILEAIETLGSATRKQLEEETKIKGTSLRRHLEKLCADGLVDSRGKGSRVDPYTYEIRASKTQVARVPALLAATSFAPSLPDETSA